MKPRWKKTAPRKAGRYLFRCDEIEQIPEVRDVYPGPKIRGYLPLWVKCQDTGTHPVQLYHDSLINPSWKLVEAKSELAPEQPRT